MTDPAPRKKKPPPPGWMYIIVLAIIAGGGGASVWLATARAGKSVAAQPRMIVPGKVTATLAPGNHGVFVETRAVVDGKATTGPATQPVCSLAGPGDVAVPLNPPDIKESYDTRGFRGKRAFEVQIEHGGAHILECSAPAGTIVAIGDGAQVWDMVPGLAGLVVCILAGLGLFLFVFVRRRGANRA